MNSLKSEYEAKTRLLRELLVKEYYTNLPYDLRVPKDILNQYRLHEKLIIINDDDRDLFPIALPLPEPPPYHLIDGFGLPASEQYFRRPQMSVKMQNLMKTLGERASIPQIWEELDRNRTYYSAEIYWIEEQWHHRLHGYWFFNNGVPTYIDGWHWLYLSWWQLDSGFPEFRYRDKMFFFFARYCYTTTEAPFFYRVFHDKDYEYFSNKEEALSYIDKNGLLMQPEKGNYLVDFGRRTVFGFNYPKHRREGATFRGELINYAITSMTPSVHGGIQSMDELSAKTDVYEDRLLIPFRRVPFFFKPIYQNSLATSLVFDTTTSSAGNGGFASIAGGLESKITYKAAGERQYDGTKLKVYHGDEVGKQGGRPYNLIERWNVVLKTLAQGSEIHGLAIHTSTVSDTAGNAGRNFWQLCKLSKFEIRSRIDGRTQSGLLNMFTSAKINYDGFTDKYGCPIVGKPTQEQKEYIRNKVGSEEHLLEQFRKVEDDPISYYESKREYPLQFRDCFLSAGRESGFNLKILTDRMAEIDFRDDLTPLRGNFEWVDKFGGDVKFVPDAEGKFELSYTPPVKNKHVIKNGKKCPANTDLFVASADPFRFENVKGGKKSKGAGCVFLRHDPIIDPSSKDTKLWQTNRAVCTYEKRVDSKEIYKEDMLKMVIYHGTKIFPENNVNDIYEYFKLHGFEEYLQYRYTNGIREPNPGFSSQIEMKQRMFGLIMEHVENHGMAERHREVLQQITDIQGLDDMTNYDLFVAFGGCLLAIYYEDFIKSKSEQNDSKSDPLIKYLTGQY